ncbi:MAG: T9SS type A sorting domain-containing protein [Bacteroidota bacterium]
MKNRATFRLLFFLFTCYITNTYSQQSDQIEKYRNDNYGSPTARKKAIVETNLVRTLFRNDGQIGYWPDRPSGEWPKESGVGYLDGIALLIGAEFIAPGNQTTVHSIATSYRDDIDFDPLNYDKWILEPVPGYSNVNSEQPAISTDQTTWPESWPEALLNVNESWDGYWYGIYGKGITLADYETFFVMDDSRDKEFAAAPYNFFPVLSDPNRGGLGLRIETRGMAWQNPLLEDFIIWQYDIFNISDYNYEKALFGFYVDSNVGEEIDADDRANYNQSENIIYAYDNDNYSSHLDKQVGYVGLALLDTPDDSVTGDKIGLTSFFVDRIDNKGPNETLPMNDEILWNKLQYGSFDTTLQNSNIIMGMGCGLFKFNSGTKEKLVMGLIFGDNYDDLLLNKNIAERFYNNNYDIQSINNSLVEITNLDSLKELSGEVEIEYITVIENPTVVLKILTTEGFYRSIDGSYDNVGKFILDTREFIDGIFYKIKIESYGINQFATFETDYLRINNDGNGQPQLKFVVPNEQSVLKNEADIEWICGDADFDTTYVSLYYGMTDSNNWNLIVRNLHQSINTFRWDITDIANGNDYLLKAILINKNDTVEVVSQNFTIQNEHQLFYGNDYTLSRNTIGTGNFYISVVSPTELTKDNYSIRFVKLDDSLSIGYQVVNLSDDRIVVNPTAFSENNEGPIFEGIRLIVNNDLREIEIDSLTGWVSGQSNYELTPTQDQSSPTRNVYSPCDYKLIFYNNNIYTAPYTRIETNFIVYNLTEDRQSTHEIFDNNSDRVFSSGDDIVIIEYNGTPTFANAKFTWRLLYREPTEFPIPPTEGDVFILTAAKPFRENDEIIFSTVNLPVSVADEKVIPNDYSLLQNYPNPFNPSTTIEYTIHTPTFGVTSREGNPRGVFVTLRVYDILGREITTLVNEYQQPGKYKVNFNADQISNLHYSLPSGVYFYTLHAGDYYQTKKMLLIK